MSLPPPIQFDLLSYLDKEELGIQLLTTSTVILVNKFRI